MNAMFEEAMVEGYEGLIPCMVGMERDPDDRHVLAAAVRCGADAIVTSNLKDFPQEAVDRYGIDLMSPDQFLVHQYHLDPETVLDKLHEQAVDSGHRVSDLLAKLAVVAQEFAELASNPI